MTVQPAAAPVAVPNHIVITPSGQSIEVQGDGERAFYEGQRAAYQDENHFSVAADLLDLDRLLFFELLTHRMQALLGRGTDYYGDILSPSQEAECRRVLKETSPLISTIKNDLGMTKAQRDKAQFESVGSYIVDLKARAREFGVHRERQLNKALALINELFAVLGAYDRADEVERGKLGFESAEEILEWIRTIMRPEFDAVDAHFREHQQRAWIRSI